MRFWDTSAVVPLLVDEPATEATVRVLASDPEFVVWWGTGIECASALARLEREGALTTTDAAAARERLDAVAAAWHEVEPTDAVRRTAVRLLRVHPLRAADALQLAAAWVASEGRPDTLPFVSHDDRLRAAADREGFRLEPR